MQFPCCHQSTEKGEIVRAYFTPVVSMIDDNALCGLIVCVDLFRDYIDRHETVYLPSMMKNEDGYFSDGFFLVN